jgi:DNA modification methylase
VPLVGLLGLVLLWAAFLFKSPTQSGVSFAAENEKEAEPAEKGKEKDTGEKAVRRPDHNHPAFGERTEERNKLVSRYIEAARIRDKNVLKAMRTVPRHGFVQHPDRSAWTRNLRRAYGDYPLPIGLNQTISQPYIVAYMTEALKLDPNSKVFEVGTGSGYQAAVCAEIAREVYTVEIIEKLAERAKERLKKLGSRRRTGISAGRKKGPSMRS